MNERARMKVAASFIAFATVAHMLGFIYGTPQHLWSPTWPPHASWHLLLALFWAVGLDLVILAVVAIPFMKGEKWTLWVLFSSLFFVHGGYLIASMVIPTGTPPAFWENAAVGLDAALYAIGLALGWLTISSKDRP